jgi:hypothetical protein
MTAIFYGESPEVAVLFIGSGILAIFYYGFGPRTATGPRSIQPLPLWKPSTKKIEELSPQSGAQRSLRSEALTMALDVGRTRLLLFERLGASIPVAFLVALVFWLCIIFASFGLFAPRNATVITVLCVCALSVSGAIFLILELDPSFEGLLQVSGAPLRTALAQLGR